MGYLSRGRLDSAPSSGVRLIQLRDLSRDGILDLASAQQVELDARALGRFAAIDGDVLLSNRGEPLRAVALASPPVGALVSSHFFVLRPTQPRLRADYLAWFLNQQAAQTFFHRNMVGTSLKMLNKQALELLPVEVPSAEIQIKLAKLAELNLRHKKLNQLLQEKMDLLVSNISIHSERSP